jgi:hypothetical protein
MSLPTHVLNVAIVTNGNMTTTISSANGNSIPMNLDANDIATFNIQAVFTGAPVGTIELQASDDNPPSGTPVNWTPITSTITSVSAAGTYSINYDFPGFSWVQLVYIPTSGSGTLNARINGKRR